MAEVNATRMAQLRRSCPDFPPDVASGIVVTRVAPRSPAEAAGLQEDDVIVGVAGVVAGQGLTVGVLADALKEAIGSSLELLVVREQQQQQQQQQGQAAVSYKQGQGSGAGNSRTGSSSSSSSSSRYTYVAVTVNPVEASAG
jgi:S1-C subfamily serine protease